MGPVRTAFSLRVDSSTSERVSLDEWREARLRRAGYRALRFSAEEVLGASPVVIGRARGVRSPQTARTLAPALPWTWTTDCSRLRWSPPASLASRFKRYATSWISRRTHKWTFDALARAKCPVCAAVIGPDEAQRASDRSDKLIGRHLVSSVEAGFEGHWPVLCPGCCAKLVYWTSTRTVHTAQQLLDEGWLKSYDVDWFE